MDITLADLSPQGAGIIIGTPVYRGSRFFLKFSRLGAEPLHVLGEAVHVQQMPDENYRIGVRFLEIAEHV